MATTIGELCENIYDGPHATPKKTGRGPIFLGISNLSNGRLDLSDTAHLSEADFARWTRRVTPQPGDVVFSYETRLGEAAMIPEGLTCCLGRRMGLLRPDRSKTDPRFLLYLWLSPDFQRTIAARAVHGSTVDRILLTELPEYPVEIPELRDQQRIAHILGALDDKIELNRRMNRTLEAIARAIFKSWFIDFDPVIDNAIRNGKPIPDEFAERAEIRREILPRSSNDAELSPSTPERGGRGEGASAAPHSSSPSGRGGGEGVAGYRHLFPDRFQDSPLGKIPKGWEVSTVGKEFNLTMGQSPPGATYNEDGVGLPFFQGRRDFGSRFPKKRVFCTAPKRICEAGDALVSVRAPVGDVNMASEKLCVGRGLAAVRHVSGSRSYTYYSMLSLRRRFEEYEAEGTVFGAINKAQFSGLECVAPRVQLAEAFENRLAAVDETISLNESESIQLASVRDTLLPRLLAGELSTNLQEEPT